MGAKDKLIVVSIFLILIITISPISYAISDNAKGKLKINPSEARKASLAKNLESASIAFTQEDLELLSEAELIPVNIRYHNNVVDLNIADQIGQLAISNGGEVQKIFNSVPFLTVLLKEANVEAFRNDVDANFSSVTIQVDSTAEITLDVSTNKINAPLVWDMIDGNGDNIRGKGVKIAIIDTGIDQNHPDFVNRIVDQNDFVPAELFIGTFNLGDGDDDNIANDQNGHGTHVAGIAAGSGAASNGKYIGVAPEAELIPVKALNAIGLGFNSWIASGIEFATDAGADIISMSLGGPSDSELLKNAVNYALDNGVIVVISAGNSGANGFNTIGFPGRMEKVITVGATDDDDGLAFFSSKGPTNRLYLKPEIVAPGVDTCSADLNSDNIFDTECNNPSYAPNSGTSMSAPHVSGAAALIKQANPGYDNADVKSILVGSAVEINSNLYGEYYVGAGRLDILKAINSPVKINPIVNNLGMYVGNPNSIHTSFDIKNVDDRSYGFIFNINQVREKDLPIHHVESQFSNNNVCLTPGEARNIEMTLIGLQNLPKEDYGATVLVESYPDCDFNAPNENVYRMLIGFSIGHPFCGQDRRYNTKLETDITGCNFYGMSIFKTNDVTIDCQGHSISGNAGTDGIIFVDSDNANVKNCNIDNFSFGMRVDEGLPTYGYHINNNTITDTYAGIRLHNTRDALVENNHITGTLDVPTFRDNFGVQVHGGSNLPENNNIIRNNVFVNTSVGIEVAAYQDGNTLEGNTITNTNDGIFVLGFSDDNVIRGNTITNAAMNGIEINIVTKRNIIEGNTVTDSNTGILIQNSDDGIVRDNIITGNNVGLKLLGAFNNMIYNNFFDNIVNVNDTG